MALGAIGAAAKVGGGILSGIGQAQRSSAFRQAARTGRIGAENQQRLSAANQRMLEGGFDPLIGQRQDELDALIQAIGPAETQRMLENRELAESLQTDAAGDIRGRIRTQELPPGSAIAERAATFAEQQAAPGRSLRALQLARAMGDPARTAAASRFGDVMQTQQRRFGELSRSAALREALAEESAEADRREFLNQLAGARRKGVGLGVAGQFLSNIGDAMTMSPPTQRIPVAEPQFIGTPGVQQAAASNMSSAMRPSLPLRRDF